MRSYFPVELIFDIGAVSGLPGILEQRGISRPLIVTDRGIAAAGILDRVRQTLPAVPAVFDQTCENPLAGDVHKALAIYRENACDGVIGLGGGSSIDCAKGVALMATHPGSIEQYAATAPDPRPIGADIAPLIVIPTTAGTGSEMGRGLGISVSEGAPKLVVYSEHLIPRVTICDPELTVTMPPSVTAATGIDALSHCIEGYLSTTDHPIADAMALDAIARIVEALPRAVSHGDDIAARKDMLLAAVMGGMAMHKGLGPAHAAGVPLDFLGLRHGVLIAILLPHAVRFLAPAVQDRLGRIAAAMGVNDAAAVPEALAALNKAVGMPARLSEIGVREEHIGPAATEAAGAFFNRLSARKGTVQDYKDLLYAAL